MTRFCGGVRFSGCRYGGRARGGVNDWCRAANLILVPMLPSTRDMEPTLRTLDIVRESGTGAKAYVIVNNFYAYGTLDRQLVEYP